MLVDVATETVIAASLDRVSHFSAEPANAPQWYANIKSVEWKTAPNVRVGAKAAFVAHFLGRTMKYTYEIVEYVPGTRLTMRTAEGPFPMQTTYE